MSRYLISLASLVLVLFAATACGSDEAQPQTVSSQDVETPIPVEPDGGIGDGAGPIGSAEETPIPVEPDGGIGDGAGPIGSAEETPIPVEPDGGIGDGAAPLPGAPEQPGTNDDWHGATFAETNCPGVEWQRVEAGVFTFSVPTDFVDQQAQGIDSEFAIWNSATIEMNYDYGWYSGPLDRQEGPVEVTPINYGGFEGTHVVATAASASEDRGFVGVHFPDLGGSDGQTNGLTLLTFFDDPNDEIVARCIAGSIEWKITP